MYTFIASKVNTESQQKRPAYKCRSVFELVLEFISADERRDFNFIFFGKLLKAFAGMRDKTQNADLTTISFDSGYLFGKLVSDTERLLMSTTSLMFEWCKCLIFSTSPVTSVRT